VDNPAYSISEALILKCSKIAADKLRPETVVAMMKIMRDQAVMR
jgi:hypothetical protein